MNTSAFVAATPIVSRAAAPLATSSFSSRSVSPAVIVPKRARVMMTQEAEDKSVPQGFTMFSEQLNGRAAMIGFVLAVATEAITGEGIVGQLGSLVKGVEHVLPF